MKKVYEASLVTLVLFVLSLCVHVAAVETEDETLLAGFDAARESWLQNVSLYGTYTFKRTGLYSEEEAHTKNIEDKYIVARGFLCKLRAKYRLQELYTKEPLVEKAGDVEWVSGRSSDAIVNRNYRIHFEPEQGKNFAPSGSLGKMSAYTISNVMSGLETFSTPFSLFLKPIDEMPSNTLRDPKYSVTRLEEGRELLSFTGKNTNGYKYVKEVLIKTEEKIPVVEQISLHTFKESSDQPFSSTVQKGLEWKLCDGISVPSRVRQVSGPLKPIGIDADTWIVSEWQSNDLGVRSPTDKDFVLQLPPDVGLSGMNHYPKGGLVDIDAITDEDFLPEGRYEGQETWVRLEDMESSLNRHVAIQWTLTILGIALILWGLIETYRRRKNSS